MKLSIVIPTYLSESNLPTLISRLTSTLEKEGFDFEVIFVNDASPDNTLSILKEFSSKSKRIKVINLSRNFGQQASILAGLKFSSGQMVVVMDDDLQDPPELIPDLVRKLEEGYDVVYAVRKNRQESYFKRLGYWFFYSLLDKLSDVKIPRGAGDFCIMQKQVVIIITEIASSERFVRGLRAWIGFKQTGLAYDRQKRNSGSPSYTLPKIVQLATDGWISYSMKPLRLALWLGLIWTSFSGTSLFILVCNKIFNASILSEILSKVNISIYFSLFLAGINLVFLGIIGEYLGRLYLESKDRPKFIIQEFIGFN
jgi:dolichol-phosphate mannosyltransferase